MKRIAQLITLLCLLLCAPLHAVTVKKLNNPTIFGIQFETDKQEFYARAERVTSISIQSYVTNTYRVREIVIDLNGSPLQLRIYNTSLIDPKGEAERLKKMAKVDSVGIPNVNMPEPLAKASHLVSGASNAALFKDYPVTTHAKTIEFQVSTEAELLDLYAKLRDNWLKLQNENAQQTTQATETNTANGEEVLAPRLSGRLFIVN